MAPVSERPTEGSAADERETRSRLLRSSPASRVAVGSKRLLVRLIWTAAGAGRNRAGAAEAAGPAPLGAHPDVGGCVRGRTRSRGCGRASALWRAVDTAEGERDPGGQSPMSGGNAQSVGRLRDNAQIWGKLGGMPSRFPGCERSTAHVLAILPRSGVYLGYRKKKKNSKIRVALGTP